MDRITNAQMNDLIGRYVRGLEALGMLEGGLHCDVGSKTYGNAYRLFFRESGTPVPGTINGYLGMTKREAYDTLYAMTLTLEAVGYHQHESKDL